ncbi:DMT family transporter [Xanthobacteraceae bacterium Astr-EGSB]|uniref:DMT family transporter n=1 Tax=Astrobacterium formosum TaxID=3069710 RepID=UPI0027B253A5|nr:DMT family transporter [Xanthobacteraceae bacterium Astr-EGSB]
MLLTLCSLFWAGNSVVGRLAAGHVPPFSLTWMRWALAFVLLLPLAGQHLIRDREAIRRQWVLMLVFAATGNGGYNAINYYALGYTEVINALLLQSTAPLSVAIWTFLLFRERLTTGQALGIVLSLSGAITIVCRGDLGAFAAIDFNRGDVWILAALAAYALYTALLRLRAPMHPLSFLAATVGASVIVLTPVAAWELATGQYMRFDAPTLAILAYVAIFPSLLSYLFLNRGVELIGANRAAPFIHLMPVFGSAMAIAFLGERLHLYHALGYALVVAGVAIAARR